MTDRTDISDETLTAYLDDALSAPDRAQVDAALGTDRALQARLQALDVSTATLRDSADAMLRHAPKMPDLPTQTASRAVWPLVAGALAGCAVGVAVGMGWTSEEDPHWVEAVANYQSLYVTDTLRRGEREDRRVRTLSNLSDAVDLDLTPLLDIEGISYRRAQMLGIEGGPLVQVAYLDGDVPIAICVTLRGGADLPVKLGEHFGMSSAYWQKDGRGFLVIGGDNAELIRKVAEQVDAAI